MTRNRKITIIGLVVLVVLVVYTFFFGKMFPYSPVIIGFEKHELTNTIIYAQKGVSFNDYERIDTLIPPSEKFHDLEFLTKPRIFLFSDSINYIRHSPSKARFCAFYNGRLFVTPWALNETLKGEISMEIYLTHELSHSLLHQHSGLINAIKYPEWLLEGIAVYSSNQMGTSFYPGKKETYQSIRSGDFMPPGYFKTRNEDRTTLKVENRIPFMYSEFACIVDYLIANFGKEKFLFYMKSLIKDNKHDKIFKEVYKVDFDKFVIDFRQFVEKTQDLEISLQATTGYFGSVFATAFCAVKTSRPPRQICNGGTGWPRSRGALTHGVTACPDRSGTRSRDGVPPSAS